MSREIKFRAWDNANKEWLNKYDAEDLIIRLDGSYEINRGWGIVKPDLTIEQYTGLKDKNGKEIYEGDIVEEDIDFNSKMTDGTFKYKVYWNEDELCWSLDPIGPESIHNDLWELNSSCRVIGNIHENPELLGGNESSFADRFGSLTVEQAQELNEAAKWYCGHEITTESEK